MSGDYRIEWIKKLVLNMLNLKENRYFEEMMASKEDLEDEFVTFLDDNYVKGGEGKIFFYIFKTPYEKLIEEEIFVKVPKKDDSFTKKKKKGKEKERKSKRGSKDALADFTSFIEGQGEEGMGEEDVTEEGGEEEDVGEEGEGEELGEEEEQLGFIPEEQSPVPTIVSLQGEDAGVPAAPLEGEDETEASTIQSPDITEPAEIEDTSKKGAKGKGKKGKKGKKTDQAAVEPEVPHKVVPKVEYVLVKQMVQRLTTDYTLHGGFVRIGTQMFEGESCRIIYLYRKTNNGIPYFETEQEANLEMVNYIFYGTSNANFLSNVINLCNRIYAPLISKSFTEPAIKRKTSKSEKEKQKSISTDESKQDQSEGQRPSDTPDEELETKETGPTEKEEETTPIKDELTTEVTTLTQSLVWVCEHVEDEVDLPMVDLSDIIHSTRPDDVLIKDPKIVQVLDEAVTGWENHIIRIMENYEAKTPVGKGPLAEYEYWHDIEAALSSVVEQLKKPLLVRISDMVEKALPELANRFIFQQLRLRRHYGQAKDNVKFLSTVLRFLKTITQSNDFKKVTLCIPLLMDGLELIWILSNYYNNDEVMVPFMERIVWCLLDKSRKFLNNETLFRNPIDVVKKLTEGSREMLEMWQTAYMTTRQRIEDSGKGARWEFDRRKLFSASNYMARVCKDLNEVSTVIFHFKNIFGPQLRSIVSDPQSIDNVAKRVDRLVVQIENTDFDIFDMYSKENWDAIMVHFYKEVKILEEEALGFIDQSFKMIRSSEDALDMLLKFKLFETRKIIMKKLMSKFDVILDQYVKEILLVDDNFTRNKRQPVLYKNMPARGSAIYWARLLYYKLKRPILKFQKVPEIMNSSMKDDTFNQYLKLAKELKAYEQSMYTKNIV